MSEFQCYHCGNTLAGLILPLSRRETCRACEREMHVCRMCRHFRSQRRDWCGEERAEQPASDDMANFCDYHHLNPNAYQGDAQSETDAALDKLNDLFN
ncbi:MAG: hypothetical protein AAGA23_00825 [Pseudomonadota bacterium]